MRGGWVHCRVGVWNILQDHLRQVSTLQGKPTEPTRQTNSDQPDHTGPGLTGPEPPKGEDQRHHKVRWRQRPGETSQEGTSQCGQLKRYKDQTGHIGPGHNKPHSQRVRTTSQVHGTSQGLGWRHKERHRVVIRHSRSWCKTSKLKRYKRKRGK